MDSVFDAKLFCLGNLCKRGHDWNGSGQSLRYTSSRDCLECHKVKSQGYYQENRERIARRRKAYYQENKERWRELEKKRKEADPEAWKEAERRRSASYRLRHGERYRKMALQRSKLYAKNHPERVRARKQKYRQSPNGRLKTIRLIHKRRSQKRSNHNAVYNPTEVNLLFQQFDLRCAYCGHEAELTLDHFLPISSGGSDCLGNLVPACRSCNLSKHKSDPLEWYKRQPFYSKNRWKKILKVLGKLGVDYHQLPLF